jgi:serine/threonine-protein kinase
MGAVYVAAPLKPSAGRRLCLVKTLKTGLASVNDYRPRFIDESRVAVLLRHPNLCWVFEGGEDQGEFYLAMELIEGVTFKRLVSMLQQRGAQLSTTQATALAVGVLRGLHAAHATTQQDGRLLNVVHRDVSPHNAMVDVNGTIKVIDFGLATSVLKETFTESAVVLGKSAYMAPEQARGEDVTPSVDQYAAAIVLYELLTDDRFYGDLQSRAIWGVVGSGRHAPRAWAEVPPAYHAVLKRALSPNPADRFPNCGAFADALVAIDPKAISDETIAGLGTMVRRLKPDELDTIATARLKLAAWDAAPKTAPILTAPSGPTERVVRPPPTTTDEHETAETSATVVTRPRQLQKRSPLPVAAAASLITLVVVGAGIVIGLRAGPDPTPTPPLTTTTTTTTAMATAPADPAVIAAEVAAKVATEAAAKALADAAAKAAAAEEATKAAKDGAANAALTFKGKLLARRDRLKKKCRNPCVAQLYDVVDPAANLTAFKFLVETCERECK